MVSTQKTNSRRRTTGGKKIQPRFYIICAASICAVLLILFSVFASDAFGSTDICHGVRAGGVELGGLSLEEAAVALGNLSEDPFAGSAVTLKAENGPSATIDAAGIDLSADLEATIKNAHMVARDGGFLHNMMAAFRARLFGREIPMVPKYDYPKLEALLTHFSEEVGGTLKEHEVQIGEEEVTLLPGHPGKGISVATAKTKFLEALKAGKQTAADLETEDTFPADLDAETLYELTYLEPQDATYEKTGSKAFVITPETDGHYIDKDAAVAVLEEFKKSGEPVTLPLIITRAEVTKKDLEGNFFSQVLGKGTTNYVASNVARSTNVELAAKYVDGTVLLPGEVFSYNGTVGERSAARGFKVASVYENNQMVDGLGGGICQTSSTMYVAVLHANLEVVERHEHSLAVTYAPLGVDATVAYGSLDFRFRNNTKAPLKIDATWGGGTVSISLLGTKPYPNRTVKITTKTVSTTPFTTKEIPDPSLPQGKTEEVSKGFEGSVVNTYMTVYDNGAEMETKFLHTSTYNMSQRVIKVGVGQQAAQSPSPTVTGTPVPSSTPGTPLPSPSLPPVSTATPTPTATQTPEPGNTGEPQRTIPPGL